MYYDKMRSQKRKGQCIKVTPPPGACKPVKDAGAFKKTLHDKGTSILL